MCVCVYICVCVRALTPANCWQTNMQSHGDPHLERVKTWIITNRQDVMLLIEVGIIETTDCSWNWIATLRFLWAKATIVSSHLTSKFRPDDDVSGDHRGGGSGERGDVPQTVGGLAGVGEAKSGAVASGEGGAGGEGQGGRTVNAGSGEGPKGGEAGGEESWWLGGRIDIDEEREAETISRLPTPTTVGAQQQQCNIQALKAALKKSGVEDGDEVAMVQDDAAWASSRNHFPSVDSCFRENGARRRKCETRSSSSHRTHNNQSAEVRMLYYDTFSAELEAQYQGWRQSNLRCRLHRGTPWARAIVVSCVLNLLIDLGRFGFHFSRVCEHHKFTLFRVICVAIFACAPALPDRLVVGRALLWRFLGLGIGLSICAVSLLHSMAWWHMLGMAFIVTVLSGVLSDFEALSLPALLSMTHLVKGAMGFGLARTPTLTAGNRWLELDRFTGLEKELSFPVSEEGREASFTLLFTDFVMTLLLCLVSTGVIWSDHRLSRILFVVKLATESTHRKPSTSNL